jgi:hypothetical protein
LVLYFILSFLQISSLPPSELGPIVCYPRLKELTDDEEEPASSPTKKRKAPSTMEDAEPSHEEPMAEEPVADVHRRVRGSGGRMRGVGKRIVSRHPSPALRGQLETVPESAATIQLLERK